MVNSLKQITGPRDVKIFWPCFILYLISTTTLANQSHSPIPSPTVLPSPEVVLETISPGEAAALLRVFERKQISDQKSLQHQYDLDSKNLKASQKVKEKEFLKSEKDTFMSLRKDGKTQKEIREYVKQRRDKLKNLKNDFKNELKNLKDSQAQDKKEKSELRRTSRVEFESYLRKNQKPPESYWKN